MSQAAALPLDTLQKTSYRPESADSTISRDRLFFRPLASESNFYNRFDWSLNPFPAVGDVCDYFNSQLKVLQLTAPGWQRDDIYRNVYLLGCAILDSVDDFLLGPKHEFSKISAAIPLTRGAVSVAERLCRRAGQLPQRQLRRLARWREQWQLALIQLLKSFVTDGQLDDSAKEFAQSALRNLSAERSFDRLLQKHIRVPGAFRSQDLSHFDFLALGRKFVEQFPERERPITVLGLRTAGSYFAPLLHAFLETQNYLDVDSVTVRPKHGISKTEAEILARSRAKASLLLIVDEPIGTGSTLMKAVQLARSFSVHLANMVILSPLHSGFSHLWKNSSSHCLLSNICTLTLPPEEWYKEASLDRDTEQFLHEYFSECGLSVVSVESNSPRANNFNKYLESISDKKGHTRIKRVYELQIADSSGAVETRYVLAKGVGWGWLSYHGFLAGERLAQFVAPTLGLRNGILYTEWQPQGVAEAPQVDRDRWIEQAGRYIASRARNLRLSSDPATALILEHRNNGLANLASYLCRAYGSRPAPFFSRGRITHELSRLACPCPSFIDGQMRPAEWINGGQIPLKGDFEHHGLGRTELNMTDPAFDLADSILSWRLSYDEEKALLQHYIEASGDTNVSDRLLINKLIAGIRARDAAAATLTDPRLLNRHEEFNRDYITASNFLVLHTMRYFAELCCKPNRLSWHAPLVALDVDGVLDKQVIGFPSTSWAGIQAISLLHAHNFAVVLNTARSIPEVKEYCKYYGFLGGVAEYGAYVWDAITGQERALITEQSMKQLHTLSEELRRIPGIFVNDDYKFSIRAYTFDGEATKAVPGLLIQNLISKLELDRLHFHQTYTDTAVVANEADKGKGLIALLDMVGKRDLLGAAVGDSEADLPMFSVAKTSFAPGHISCRDHASAIGCHISRRAFQPGLLSVVRRMVHPDSNTCQHCRVTEPPDKVRQNLVFQVLQHADESRIKRLARALFHPRVITSFVAS